MARCFDKLNDDHLNGGNIANITGDEMTLSCWMKLDTTNGEQKLVSRWDDSGADFQYLMSITSAEKPQFVISTGSNGLAIGSTTISTGSWHNITGRYNGSNVRVYLGGVQDGSSSKSGNITNVSNSLVIGAGSGGSGSEQPLDGYMGHVAIWDVALSANQIESLANGVSPLQFPEGLVFYNPMNGANPELDIVGGNTLTVNGTTVSEEPPIPNSIKAP